MFVGQDGLQAGYIGVVEDISALVQPPPSTRHVFNNLAQQLRLLQNTDVAIQHTDGQQIMQHSQRLLKLLEQSIYSEEEVS